jgi:hypothetical protein
MMPFSKRLCGRVERVPARDHPVKPEVLSLGRQEFDGLEKVPQFRHHHPVDTNLVKERHSVKSSGHPANPTSSPGRTISNPLSQHWRCTKPNAGSFRPSVYSRTQNNLLFGAQILSRSRAASAFHSRAAGALQPASTAPNYDRSCGRLRQSKAG